MNDSLPVEIKKEFKTVGNLFTVLERKKNFKVDAMRGQIVLLLRKLELHELEIKLKFVKEEEVKEETMESKNSEFGGIIENLEFPEFGKEEKPVEGFQKEMVIYQFELEKWKKQLEEKKDAIKKMTREKRSDKCEYQG